jgi:hypothetical protein
MEGQQIARDASSGRAEGSVIATAGELRAGRPDGRLKAIPTRPSWGRDIKRIKTNGR